MTIFMQFTVSDAQLTALRTADTHGWITATDGVRWDTLRAMARQDRAWVTLDPSGRRARITRRGIAMIRIGREERERHQARAKRRSMARSIDPFALIAGTHIRTANRF